MLAHGLRWQRGREDGLIQRCLTRQRHLKRHPHDIQPKGGKYGDALNHEAREREGEGVGAGAGDLLRRRRRMRECLLTECLGGSVLMKHLRHLLMMRGLFRGDRLPRARRRRRRRRFGWAIAVSNASSSSSLHLYSPSPRRHLIQMQQVFKECQEDGFIHAHHHSKIGLGNETKEVELVAPSCR